jgi:hypothetical protein
MNDKDGDPPGKVVEFGPANRGAIGRSLREMYAALVRSELPQELSALAKELERAMKKDSEPKT